MIVSVICSVQALASRITMRFSGSIGIEVMGTDWADDEIDASSLRRNSYIYRAYALGLPTASQLLR